MRFLSTLLIAICALSSTAYAQSDAYPSRPVKVIVPLTPGSGADQAGRIVTKALSELWKQPVVIENRPGAGGLIGTGAVVQSAPDGYTLLIQSASYAANPAIYKKLPYDPVKGMVDINNIGFTPYVLVTGLPGPYSSLKDLIGAAKSRTGGLPFSSAGVGSSTHLAAEFFNQTAGIQMVHVPYKGSPEAIQGTIMGDTAFYMAPESTVRHRSVPDVLRHWALVHVHARPSSLMYQQLPTRGTLISRLAYGLESGRQPARQKRSCKKLTRILIECSNCPM